MRSVVPIPLARIPIIAKNYPHETAKNLIRLIEAVDGQEALDKFMERRSAVDMLVTDVIMPKLDGKSLYKEIEKVRPDMRVLFMSGYTKDIVIERGILDNELNFLAKPVTSSDLLRKVRQILDLNLS